jgi:hypothetical protein
MHQEMNSRDMERWYQNPNEAWEDIASWFYEETGHLRPGKDEATEGSHTETCCMDAWLEWSRNKKQLAISGLLAQRDRYRAAMEQVIELNIQHAKDMCGDPTKAESCACVRTLREALGTA